MEEKNQEDAEMEREVRWYRSGDVDVDDAPDPWVIDEDGVWHAQCIHWYDCSQCPAQRPQCFE